ncbi:MAG: hypothetical protein ACLGPL_05835, partial [Acidobacteriota bacterium]
MVGFYFVPGSLGILILVTLVGVAHTVSVPAQAAHVAQMPMVVALGPGRGMGVFRFWERLGNVTGPLIVGFLVSRLGFEKAVAVLGAAIVGACLFYVALALGKRSG